MRQGREAKAPGLSRGPEWDTGQRESGEGRAKGLYQGENRVFSSVRSKEPSKCLKKTLTKGRVEPWTFAGDTGGGMDFRQTGQGEGQEAG